MNEDNLMRICARCGDLFFARTVTNIYCTAECRRDQSNEKNSEKNKLDKAREKGLLHRVCDTCEITVLSRYNPLSTCEPCIKQREYNARHQLMKDLGL